MNYNQLWSLLTNSDSKCIVKFPIDRGTISYCVVVLTGRAKPLQLQAAEHSLSTPGHILNPKNVPCSLVMKATLQHLFWCVRMSKHATIEMDLGC
jgi:hypothetical protein